MKIKNKNNTLDPLHGVGLDDYTETKKWYEEIAADPKTFPKCSEQVLIELKEEAKKCNDTEVNNFQIKKSRTNSDYQWMKTMLSKGTVGDKVAAHTVLIQENPVCNLENIRNLIGMVKVGKKKECLSVMGTLVELFLSDLLKPDQKLKAFHQRPLSLINELTSGNAVTRRKLLSSWYFEDQLKEIYTSFVLALNTVAHDTVDSNKEKALSAMYKLLAGNPEQEKNLLSHIVNKLGDPSQKVASKVIYCLTQLLYKHINMQGVVLNEIEKLLFRSNISTRAQYYSLCFLSQYHLSHEAVEVARKLIEVYFSFFKACVKKGDVDSRMMSALLMGINRAFPYAKFEFSKFSDHIDTLYRLVHLANFNTSLQALILLNQVSDVENSNKMRFYSTLYRKLLDPCLLTATNKAMLLSLIYKALLKDTEVSRVKMFVKRLLQIAMYVEPSFSCGIMYLVSQLLSKNKAALSLISTQTAFGEDDDDSEEKYYDIKDENDDTREVEIKEEDRDEQVNKNDTEPVTNLDNSIPIEIKDEIEDEKPDIEDEKPYIEDVKPDVDVLDATLKGTASWYHCNSDKTRNKLSYNPFARNPLYGGGECCSYIELTCLKDHFHPTVALFANNLLNNETIKYNGDPLNDFALIRFLERFVFKNPKKVTEIVGKDPTFAKRKLCRPKGVRQLTVNSDRYLSEDVQNIPVDELFLYSYLQGRHKDKESRDADGSDIESVQSEEFEDMLDKMAGVKEAEEEIDFMNEIGDSLKKTDKKKKTKVSEEAEVDDDSDEDGLDDEEDDFDEDDFNEDMNEEDEEMVDGLGDDDDEDIEFPDDDDDDDDLETSNVRKKFKKSKNDISTLFASAEEFATLLEDEGSSKVKPGGSNAVSNKDNAHDKQLNWEAHRNRWVKGFDRAVSGKKFNKNKSFGKKRNNQSKGGNKNKRFKA